MPGGWCLHERSVSGRLYIAGAGVGMALCPYSPADSAQVTQQFLGGPNLYSVHPLHRKTGNFWRNASKGKSKVIPALN
jgi:hypothetical protein